MPLADYWPKLDNRGFDDLVEEARARVPRYTKELTDFNPGDPAFALIELNAWMTDLLLYRLGRVSELHYLKFLELVGIELKPAQPAGTILVFPVQRTFAGSSVVVPARLAVATADPDDKGPIVFETARSFTAINARIGAVLVHDGYATADRTAANGAGEGFAPFGDLAGVGSSLMLGLDSAVALPGDTELSLGVFVAETGTRGATSCGDASFYRPGGIIFEAWSGLAWLPLTTLADDTAGMTRSGVIRVRLPKAGAMPRAAFGGVAATFFYLRARLAGGGYDQPPRLESVRLNAVPATQAETVEYEILGGSDGAPDQTFRLANTPVLDGSLVLEVDEGDDQGFTAWREVDDFYGVDSRDPVYVLDRAKGEVRFGSEQALIGGRIPAANRRLARANIRARRYRFGGGRRGNVAAGKINVLMTSLTGLDAGGVLNPQASTGGTDEESLDEIVARAPRAIKARDRAVTAEDFEQFAKEAGPVRRAKAFALAHPRFPGIEVPGAVTLLIVPDSEGPAPRPSEALRQAVCRTLEKHRLIGTELHVTGPDYARLDLAIRAVARPDADPAEARQAIESAARAFLHPLTGGTQGTGWPFGGPLHYGELYQALAVAGVARLDDIALTLDGIEIEPCKSAAIGPMQLIELGGVDVAIEENDAGDLP